MFKAPQKSAPASLLALGMMATALSPLAAPQPSFAQSFSDTQGSWAQTCISQLTQLNVISGYPDGTFRPNSPVTRAEYAAMVGKAFPNAARTRSVAQFVDVPSNYWAYSAISTASQTGFLSGYPGNVFNPAQNIPRAQVLVSLASGLGYSPTQPVATTLNATFSDAASIPTYAETGIAGATEKRLVVNYPDVKTLAPNQLATRAEVAAFLCQALTNTGQLAATVSTQYIAGANTSSQTARVPAGTAIPVKYTAAERIIVAPSESAEVTLTVAQDIRNSRGTIAIPAGSQVVGQVQPANGGSQFVARELILNGQRVPISASSEVVKTTKNVRDPNFGRILAGAAIGSAASAGIQGITGNKTITSTSVLLGTGLGAAAAASQGRNIGSTIRDAAIGAALGAGIAGVTGDRQITPKEVFAGVAAGATVGGVLDRSGGNVIVIDPNTDLTLRLDNDVTLL